MFASDITKRNIALLKVYFQELGKLKFIQLQSDIIMNLKNIIFLTFRTHELC